jgi:hypothetical protein
VGGRKLEPSTKKLIKHLSRLNPLFPSNLVLSL